MGKYDDIINLPHHQSKKYPQMSSNDRAAQFAPFATLPGLDGELAEAGRLTEDTPELDGNQLTALDSKLAAIVSRIGDNPDVIITCFRRDEKKEGGAYIAREGRLKKFDSFNRRLVLDDGSEISLDEVIEIEERG